MASNTFTSTRYYEREWRDAAPSGRAFEHTRHRLFDDPFFRRMPFSSSMESLRNAGLNGVHSESRNASSYSATTNSHKTEERLFVDDKDRFMVVLDLPHFALDEIQVKIADDMLVIEAGHNEKKDDHGLVTRSLRRRYALPKDIDAQNFVSELTKEGWLTVRAPKVSVYQRAKERMVPVQIVTNDSYKTKSKTTTNI